MGGFLPVVSPLPPSSVLLCILTANSKSPPPSPQRRLELPRRPGSSLKNPEPLTSRLHGQRSLFTRSLQAAAAAAPPAACSAALQRRPARQPADRNSLNFSGLRRIYRCSSDPDDWLSSSFSKCKCLFWWKRLCSMYMCITTEKVCTEKEQPWLNDVSGI